MDDPKNADVDEVAPDADEPGDELPQDLANDVTEDEREIVPDEVDGEG